MRGRFVGGRFAALALGVLTALAVAQTGQAFEWDLPGERKFSIHGFYESRLLFVGSEIPWDEETYSSWRHVLSTELELSLFPDGFGPFDSMFMFTRFLVSYECIYTRACGTFNSADSYGDYHRKAVRQPASLKQDVENNQPFFAGLLPQVYRTGTLAPSQEKLNPGRRYRDCVNPPGVFANPYPLAVFCNLNQRSPLDGPIQGGVNKFFEVRAGNFTPNVRESLLNSARSFIGEEEYLRMRELLIDAQVLSTSQESQRRRLATEATLLEQQGDADGAAALRAEADAILGTPASTFDANIPTLLATRPDPNRFAIFSKSFAPDLLTAQWGSGRLRNLVYPFLATINTPIRPDGYFTTKNSLDFISEYEQGLAENLTGFADFGNSVPGGVDSDGDALFRAEFSGLRAMPFFVGPDGRRNTADDLPFVAGNEAAAGAGYTLAAPIAGTSQDRFDFSDGGVPRFTATAQIQVESLSAPGTTKTLEIYGVYNPAFLVSIACGTVGGTFDPTSASCTGTGGDDLTETAFRRGCSFRQDEGRSSGLGSVGINADGDCVEMNTASQGSIVQFELLSLLGDPSLRPGTATREPLDTTDFQLFGLYGAQLPARPRAPKQGIYFQSPGQRDIYDDRHGLVSNLDLKYSVDSLTWNHGASQTEHEFSEGYLEFEMADSQIYARVGKLIQVWGKTELFRNQDRNNPLDIGNGIFAPLEEQRVGQWASDITFSPEAFMRIGPVEDLRVELLTIYNPFEPTDLGKCGEGTAVEFICLKSFGAMANGLAAIGIVGERRPYDDYEGWERWDWGLRIEGRLDRFTFAISDFWGWDDGFYLDLVQQYERTADFDTGAPLSVNMIETTKGCKIRTNADGVPVGPDGVAGSGDEEFPSAGECLLWEKPDANGVQHLRSSNAVAKLQTVNQTIFHSICSFTFDPDEGYCAFDRLNDPRTFGLIAQILSGLGLLGGVVVDGVETIREQERGVIFRQSGEFLSQQFLFTNPNAPIPDNPELQDLGIVLQPLQQSLLGCGPSYASPCSEGQANLWKQTAAIANGLTRDPEIGAPDFGGIDLMNADGSVITQEFTALKALSPGALVGTKLTQGGKLRYLPGINFSRNGTIITVPGPNGPVQVEDGEYLDLTPNQVINMGRVGRAEFQIDPEDPREADGWVEPMPWTVNKEIERKYGAIVFNVDPNAPFDLTSPLNEFNLIDRDGPVELSNIDGEYCARWMVALGTDVDTPFNQGCTALETASANFERLLISTEIIGFDRVFDPPESLQELLSWGKSNTGTQDIGDPISGPDGIFARNQFVLRDDEVDFDVVRARDGQQLSSAELEIAPADKAAAITFLRNYDPNVECARTTCYLQVNSVLTDDNDVETGEPLIIDMPIGQDADVMAEIPVDPENPNEPPGYVETGIVSKVNLARLQFDDLPTLRRFLSGEVVNIDGAFLRFSNTQRQGLFGKFGDQVQRGRDMDGDGTTDLDRDRDGVWDGLDDGTPGPVTDDNILCGSGVPGDPLQDGAQYDPYRADEARDSQKFNEALPNGLPPRSPVFCRGVAGLLGATTQTLPVRKAGGDGRFGRRDFLWQGGRQMVFNYQKRNVFGFGLDFAEDVTKTSWGIEYSWMARKLFPNSFEYDGLSQSDEMVLSISVDRPTFFNFLNPNRSFFLNLQMFIRYLPNYEGGRDERDGMYGSAAGPVTGNIVFTWFTGYFQDRLAPRLSLLYAPWESQGAAIAGISYRWNDAFSTSIGYTQFFGHVYDQQGAYFPISQYGSTDDYSSPVLRGVAPVLYRDQAELRIRYTW